VISGLIRWIGVTIPMLSVGAGGEGVAEYLVVGRGVGTKFPIGRKFV